MASLIRIRRRAAPGALRHPGEDPAPISLFHEVARRHDFVDGVQDLLKFIYEVVWDGYNPKLKIGGILPTMYKKTTTHSPSVIETARKIWKENVMPIEVPESIAFPRAFNDGMPLIFSEPGHPAALAYMEVAKIIHPNAKATQPPIAAPVAEPVTLEPYEGNQ